MNIFRFNVFSWILFFFLLTEVVLSQIRARMRFRASGEVTHSSRVKYLVAFNILVVTLNIWTFTALAFIIRHISLWVLLTCLIPLGLIDLFLVWKFFTLVLNTRHEIKEKYTINRDPIGPCSEIILVAFCSCLVIGQMGRHTADYSIFREEKMSATGLPSHLEVLSPLIPKRSYKEEMKNDADYVF